MADYIAEVSFQDVSNLSKDRFTNTFHFSGDGTNNAEDAYEITRRVADFYLGHSTSENNLADYMAHSLTATATVTVYLESDPIPRPEVSTGTFTLPGPVGLGDLPESACVVLSYYSVRNIARQRGRLYIGPLAVGALEMDTNPRPTALLLTVLAHAAERLLANGDGTVSLGSIASLNFSLLDLVYGTGPTLTFPVAASETTTSTTLWCQRSGLGAGTFKQVRGVGNSGTKIVTYSPVTAGWIANAWHQQRRREVEATARVLFPA
jgi:hypothetical protein